MKVMVLVKASPASEAGEMPGTELLTEMGRFNEALVKAGIMLAGDRPRDALERAVLDLVLTAATSPPATASHPVGSQT